MIKISSISSIFKSKKGEGYIGTVIVVLSAMLVISFAIKLYPVFVAKNELKTFADEIMRVAEVSGQVGNEVYREIDVMRNQTKLDPSIEWSSNYFSGTRVQLGERIQVTCTESVDIGFFTFGSIPITITSKASGRSEVYWK